MLRRIPHRMDSVSYGGYKFEVLDIDHYRIDQLLVTRVPAKEEPPVAAGASQEPEGER